MNEVDTSNLERDKGGRRQSDQEYSFLLGEILAASRATEKHIAQQNGTLAKVHDTTTALALTVSKLPCELHSERLKNHIRNSERSGSDGNVSSPWLHRGSGAGVATVAIVAIWELGHMIGLW